MKAFITGVGGFVGPYLARHLREKGFSVFGIDRRGAAVESCVVEQCNITDYDSLFSIVNTVRPDVVFHLAGQSSVARSWDEPELTREVNVVGARNLFQAVVGAGIHPKILLVSSAEVYGVPQKLPMGESHPIKPISPYGESKVEQERIAQDFVESHDAHIVVARSFNHTGPGQPADFVCSNFAKQLADIEKNRQPPVVRVGDLDIRRDFSDVRDVVSAYALLLEKAAAGEVFNVCSGTAIAIGEVLDKLRSMSTVSVSVERERSRMQHAVVPLLQGDNAKLRELGWRPQIGLDSTLASILYYWRQQ